MGNRNNIINADCVIDMLKHIKEMIIDGSCSKPDIENYIKNCLFMISVMKYNKSDMISMNEFTKHVSIAIDTINEDGIYKDESFIDGLYYAHNIAEDLWRMN